MYIFICAKKLNKVYQVLHLCNLKYNIVMKKALTIAILLAIFCVVAFFSLNKPKTHKVLKVLSSTEFYVDFNDNEISDTNELVQLKQYDTEPQNYSQADILKLNYLGKNFANQKLLNKNVEIIKNEKTSVLIENSNEDYTKLLENEGYVVTETNKETVSKNIKYATTLNLVSYNSKSNKYHKLDCKYAASSPNIEIIPQKQLPKSAQPCKNCFKDKENTSIKTQNYKEKSKYPREVYEKYAPIYKDNYIELYVTDFTKYYYPSTKCFTTACKSLLNEINNAKQSIDFAIYGIDRQPEITKAILNAQKRGVKIRFVYDTNKNGSTIYKETIELAQKIKTNKKDIDYADSILQEETKSIKDAIMHNKFFIFDNKKVWTGSANITYTDLSGFNANSAVLIKSEIIAKIFLKEFEQMYNGKFHTYKSQTAENATTLDKSKLSVYFSPQDKIITKHVISLINDAHKYVYIPVFVITHKGFNTALINAKSRGVDVKVIVDATSASQKYSSVKFLRENKIPVKVENRAGKMHMKSIIIDDKYSIIGSMNFTKSGERYNDENILIIENHQLAQSFKKEFLHFWSSIPEKWLYKNPGAESHNSINSCYDGVDNDFDEKTDMMDDSCNFKLRKQNIPTKTNQLTNVND